MSGYLSGLWDYIYIYQCTEIFLFYFLFFYLLSYVYIFIARYFQSTCKSFHGVFRSLFNLIHVHENCYNNARQFSLVLDSPLR